MEKIINSDNLENFTRLLEEQYTVLFSSDQDYQYAAARTTPKRLAIKMAHGLIQGSANKDGEGIKKACAMLGLENTYKAIQGYLTK